VADRVDSVSCWRDTFATKAERLLSSRVIQKNSRARSRSHCARRKSSTVECDLLDRDQIQACVRKVIDHFDRIDILINNAGIIEVGPLDHMTREDYDRAMRLHFWAPYELISQIVPEMRLWGGGRIVNISSIGGKVAMPHFAPYSASKFALTGFSDAIRAELARDNIQVTTVAPGLMRTGSHVNAKFKGNHDAEFAWFSASAGAPLISMDAIAQRGKSLRRAGVVSHRLPSRLVPAARSPGTRCFQISPATP
jgi:Short-chain dehydrogenases of various substrate specificities